VNIQEYISSGIVESYVLGLANLEEREEFERNCNAYPEIRQAREDFEHLLEKNLMNQALNPPQGLKGRIFAEIENGQNPRSQSRPPEPMPMNFPVGRLRLTRWLAAASVILLICSTALNYYFFIRYRDSVSKYEQLVASQNRIAAANLNLQTKLQDYELAWSKMKDPAMAMVKMPGTAAHAGTLTTVYWDTRSKDVYLLVNNLPPPASDKQYQLWALVDGKPVDAGVFELQEGLSFVKMKNIPAAQGFAITLEKRGGSQSPTMDAMFVIGKVNG
jgi:anti-sigma-K factor RskA